MGSSGTLGIVSIGVLVLGDGVTLSIGVLVLGDGVTLSIVVGDGDTAPPPWRSANSPTAPMAMIATLAAAPHTRTGTCRRADEIVAPDA
jgi:hypothetical protein